MAACHHDELAAGNDRGADQTAGRHQAGVLDDAVIRRPKITQRGHPVEESDDAVSVHRQGTLKRGTLPEFVGVDRTVDPEVNVPVD